MSMELGDLTATVEHWLEGFNAGLAAGDATAVALSFHETCYWRDLVAFTWNVKTMEGREAVGAMAGICLSHVGAVRFVLSAAPWREGDLIVAWLDFETGVARGRAHLRLRDGLAFTLLTTMQEIKGHEERAGQRREMGTIHGATHEREVWSELRARHAAEFGREVQPYTLIIGGGQGGIALAARLRRLGVPSLIVERNERPGDSWRNRYRTLVLHDPVWYDHLPYLPFPDDWPVFAPKDKMGDWLEAYTRIMELDFWGSTECERASFDEASGEWRVVVNRAGERLTLRPKQLVLATGFYGPPNLPEIEGADRFGGEIIHASAYQSAGPYRGRRVVVVGSNTSAHDICADLWEGRAAEVTMIQRSSSMVVRSETLMEMGFGPLYSQEALAAGIDTETADLLFASSPFALMAEGSKAPTRAMAARDRDLLDRLAAAGFQLDFGHDGSGLLMKAWRTGGGYYIDVGCSELIASGEVKLRSKVEPVGYRPGEMLLSDGSALPCDVVIYATGYQSVQATIESLISTEVSAKLGHCWGYGSGTPGDPGPWEGEMRNLWKPTAQPALWLHGGNLHLSRFFSKFVALQIKARMEGIPTPVYAPPPEVPPVQSQPSLA